MNKCLCSPNKTHGFELGEFVDIADGVVNVMYAIAQVLHGRDRINDVSASRLRHICAIRARCYPFVLSNRIDCLRR
jgi:hypothetical protein